MNITICGGGNLGHVVSGVLGSKENVQVSLLTNHPKRWENSISVSDLNGKTFYCEFYKISSDPSDVIPNADLIILCLPGFYIHNELKIIKPYLNNATIVGSIVSSTGFFFEAFDILPDNITLFGFQRVPFISRVIEYGRKAELLGYKRLLNIAVEHCDDKESIRNKIEKLFITPTVLLKSFYEVSLSNSNPLLHPAHLYTMWKDWNGKPYGQTNYFYAKWTDEASELLIMMDNEFQQLLKKLPVNEGSIPTILDYYESTDAQSLTLKIHSIEAFKGILSPMKKLLHNGVVPDFTSRYFTEDFPYGMRFVVECANKYSVKIPTIEKVYKWGCSKID